MKPKMLIAKESGLPLMGSGAFGIVYRNTSIIEIKPITGCNLNCVFCSVDEGIDSKKTADFMVEKDYLVEELEKLVDFVGEKDIEIHIGPHGEPLLYPELVELVSAISRIKNVKIISMDTNGTLLTEKKVDELAAAGLTRINLSINSLSPENSKKIAGCNYDIERIKQIAEYVPKKCDLIIAPVLVPGFNDADIEEIIEFALRINKRNEVKLGIQNFLKYRGGRNPAKQLSWKKFYARLGELEKKYGTKLILSHTDFNIRKTKPLPKPFKKGQRISARVMCEGRLPSERIAVAGERTINLVKCNERIGKEVRVKILRDKHNIFTGLVV